MQVYLSVEARRESMNSLLWQVPALSLTAQAFLFSVSTDQGTSPTGRLITSLAGLLIVLATVQLFVRHRCMEENASRWLEQLEVSMRLPVVHRHPPFEGKFIKGVEPVAGENAADRSSAGVLSGAAKWLRARRASRVWTSLLLTLALINLVVTILAVLELIGASSPLAG